MSSIVAPAIEAEVSYRHDRATEDFRRARPYRCSRNLRNARTSLLRKARQLWGRGEVSGDHRVRKVLAPVTAWAEEIAREPQ